MTGPTWPDVSEGRVMPQERGSRRCRGQSVDFNDRLLMRMVNAARPIRLNPGLL